jgi:N-acyl-D-aspartate/D-glutamate deacylase
MTEASETEASETEIRVLKGNPSDAEIAAVVTVLAGLDVVVASVHSKLRMAHDEMTERMVRAVASPHVDILGHCTGRLVDKRAPSQFDPDYVFAACAAFGTAVEINSRVERLDPPPELLAVALDHGCMFSIDTDAHATGQLEWLPYGCTIAADGEVPIERIVNTRTADDLAEMGRLVQEAIEAGAVGFSTSRTIGHRSLWGSPVPGTFAPEQELVAIAQAMRAAGKGVFEMIPSGTVGKLENLGGEPFSPLEELQVMNMVSRESGRPVTFTLVQSPDYSPDMFREILAETLVMNAAGAQLFPQVSSRPIGLVTGLSGYHAFQRRPTYMRLASLPLADRVREMAKPEVKAAILAEPDQRVDEPGSMANVYGLFQRAAPVIYPLADPVDYEPQMSECLGARAAATGDDILSVMYDFLLEQDGRVMGSLMGGLDVHQAQEVVREMLTHPATVTGLSDAGAHVTLICDASMPSTQLTYWTRDRRRGEQIPLEFVVAKQTSRNAALYGFSDRGTLAPGLRADINVIDHERLTVAPPKAFHDLPAGGTRLIQPVQGYLATMVNGVVTRRHDADTGARPGRLVRS